CGQASVGHALNVHRGYACRLFAHQARDTCETCSDLEETIQHTLNDPHLQMADAFRACTREIKSFFIGHDMTCLAASPDAVAARDEVSGRLSSERRRYGTTVATRSCLGYW